MKSSKIKMLLKTAKNMKRYRRFKIVFLHYSRSFERQVLEVKKQLSYAPSRELFETIVPYIYKGQLPPIIWGGSCFHFELLRKAGDPFYTHLNEYGCFQSYCCYGDEESDLHRRDSIYPDREIHSCRDNINLSRTKVVFIPIGLECLLRTPFRG